MDGLLTPLVTNLFLIAIGASGVVNALVGGLADATAAIKLSPKWDPWRRYGLRVLGALVGAIIGYCVSNVEALDVPVWYGAMAGAVGGGSWTMFYAVIRRALKRFDLGGVVGSLDPSVSDLAPPAGDEAIEDDPFVPLE